MITVIKKQTNKKKLPFQLPHVSLVHWQAHINILSPIQRLHSRGTGHIQFKNMCGLKNMFWFGLVFTI